MLNSGDTCVCYEFVENVPQPSNGWDKKKHRHGRCCNIQIDTRQRPLSVTISFNS